MTENANEDATTQAAAASVEGLNAVFGEASPSSIFSKPEKSGDNLIIVASAWERAGGFGFGGGGRVGADSGGGGGGGGASQGRPVAVIKVGPGGIDVKPVIDFTKVGITVLLGVIGVWRATGKSRR